MLDQQKILGFLSVFRSYYNYLKDQGSIENYSDKTFDVIYALCSEIVKDFNEEDKIYLKRKIDSEFEIYQPDPGAILDDYDHKNEWFTSNKSNYKLFYWNRYKDYLYNSKGGPNLSYEVVNKLDYYTTDQLIDLMGDPNEAVNFSRKGLVIGDVQSGKTSNYTGLICKAADVGYKVIILLTGTLESLRVQTQIRIEEGFVGYDPGVNREYVGVGLIKTGNDPIPMSITSRSSDFTGLADQNTSLTLKNSNVPIIFVTKKNQTTLRKIREALTRLNLVPPEKQINSSLLIVDDEADNASVNTNDVEFDPTKINTEIRKLLSLFARSNYVGFTATPFANVFIDPESEDEMLKGDLFPKDFIFTLEAPSNYFGPKKIFLDETANYVQPIKDYNDSFPLVHKKDWDGNELFGSLIEAINLFLIANVIRDLDEGKLNNSHRSMLVNVSRFIKVQEKIKFLINLNLENIKRAINLTKGLPLETAEKNEFIKKLKDVYSAYYPNEKTWETIFSMLYSSTKEIRVIKVPDKKDKLDYSKNKEFGLRAIIVGGLALSRGLTLEGLMISYLYRNTATYDVLMQMGRWFGYRDKPFDYQRLCKVFMLDKTRKYFKEIAISIEDLRVDIKNMIASKKTPKEFGIRVRNESDELGITSRNKMRTSKKYVYNVDYYGNVIETPFVNGSFEIIQSNRLAIEKLIKKLTWSQESKNRAISSNINAEIVIELLNDLDIDESNKFNYFDKEQIITFIQSENLTSFDIGIVGGDSDFVPLVKSRGADVRFIERSFDFLGTSIRLSGTHRKLGGPSDTKIGLPENITEDLSLYGNSNKKYLVEGRRPLLLIYMIKLITDSSNSLHTELIQKINKENDYLVGLGIGFPRNSYSTMNKKAIYMINRKTNWYNLMKKELDEENDEEV